MSGDVSSGDTSGHNESDGSYQPDLVEGVRVAYTKPVAASETSVVSLPYLVSILDDTNFSIISSNVSDERQYLIL